jgi:hypothetical protein
MNQSDASIDLLLNAIDATAREQEYPPHGLQLYGSESKRETFRQLVRGWLETNEPESQR